MVAAGVMRYERGIPRWAWVFSPTCTLELTLQKSPRKYPNYCSRYDNHISCA
jgi:hypothetical protein